MKPIRLDIAGLNSFRRIVTIDFAPLLRDGLFGIFGPTGSGKSTILDAITLALYGKARRAGNLSGIINEAEKTCHVSFTFEVSDGADRRCYTVERLFERSKKGGAEARTVRLIEVGYDGHRQTIAEKGREVTERIGKILGISSEDFLRAVVLPQGAFSEFLSLAPAERSKMLERLFRLEHMGEGLLKTLRARRDQAAGDLRVVQERLSGLEEYNDDALLRLEEDLIRAGRNATELSATVEGDEEELRAARALSDLITELHSLQTSHDNRRADRARLTAIDETITRAERARRVAPVIEERAKGARALTERKNAYQEAAQRLADIRSLVEPARRERDAFAEESDAAIVRLEKNRSALIAIRPVAEDVASRRATLAEKEREREGLSKMRSQDSARAEEMKRACDVVRHDLEGLRDREQALFVSNDERNRVRQIGELLHERDEHETLRSEHQQSHDTAEENLRALRSDLSERRQNLEKTAADRSDIRADLERNESGMKEIEPRIEEERAGRDRLLQAIRDVETMEEDVAGQVALEVRTAGELAEKKKRLTLREQNVEHGQEEEAKLRRELETKRIEHAKALHREALPALSNDLVDGVPCPLCGSLDHPFPFYQRHDAQIRAAGGATALDVAAAEQRLEEARRRLGEAREQSAALRAEVAALQTGIETAQRDIAEQRRSIVARLRPLLPSDAEPTMEHAARRLEDINRVVASMESDRERFDRRFHEAKSRGEEIDTRYHGEEIALRSAEATLMEKERALSESRAAIDRMERRLIAIDARLVESLGGRSIDEARRDVESIADREERSDRIRAERLDREKDLRAMEEEEKEGRRIADDSARRCDRCSADVERLGIECAEREEKVHGVLRDVVDRDRRDETIDALITALEEDVSALRKKREEKERTVAEMKERLARCEQDHAHARDQMNRGEEELEELERDVKEGLARAGYRSADDALRDACDDENLGLLRGEQLRIRRELDLADARMEELREKIGRRSISRAEVEAMERSLRDRKSEADQAAAAVGGLRREVEIARAKNGEWRASKELLGKGADQSRLYDRLERYLRGNGFVNYVANERLAEICRRATRTLTTLSSGRYEVLARAGEGFVISDHRLGGERPPGTLSGGETFLVSLSLALALSDTLQFERQPLDLFFLDEGFGSLDAELLETVIDALERIASPERTIGLISHVGILRDRIQRRLIVVPPAGVEGTRVNVES